jgi:hypothetical protein
MLKEHLEIFREHLENRFRRFQKYELIWTYKWSEFRCTDFSFSFVEFRKTWHQGPAERSTFGTILSGHFGTPSCAAYGWIWDRADVRFVDTKTFAALGHSEKPKRYINIINHHKSKRRKRKTKLQIKKKWDTVFTFFLDLESTWSPPTVGSVANQTIDVFDVAAPRQRLSSAPQKPATKVSALLDSLHCHWLPLVVPKISKVVPNMLKMSWLNIFTWSNSPPYFLLTKLTKGRAHMSRYSSNGLFTVDW